MTQACWICGKPLSGPGVVVKPANKPFVLGSTPPMHSYCVSAAIISAKRAHTMAAEAKENER